MATLLLFYYDFLLVVFLEVGIKKLTEWLAAHRIYCQLGGEGGGGKMDKRSDPKEIGFKGYLSLFIYRNHAAWQVNIAWSTSTG